MSHPMVEQLRYARIQLVRGLDGLTDSEARRRFGKMNCISWIVGHLAWHEHRCWIERAQGKSIADSLNELVGYGKPPSMPPLKDMWTLWRDVTEASNAYLDSLTASELDNHLTVKTRVLPESIGTTLYRVTYHYWFHIGEGQAIRQLLGHTNLPEFIGPIGEYAPYHPFADF